MDGFLCLLKPPGMTSSDAVMAVRRMLPRGTKVGHGGTLDPDAAGVLPICIGRATRLFDYFIDKEKEYIAEAMFGITTDTQDASGRIISRLEPEKVQSAATPENIRQKLPLLTGDILQKPPVYSAIKQNGKRLYEMARQGVDCEVPERPVRVESFEYLGTTGLNRFLFRIRCRKGVYIRTLLHDLGNMLGCGATMTFLLRTQAGAFSVDTAYTLEELKTMRNLENALQPMDTPLMHLPCFRLTEEYLTAVRNGASISWKGDPEPGMSLVLKEYFLQEQKSPTNSAQLSDLLNVLKTGNEKVLCRVYIEDLFAGIVEAKPVCKEGTALTDGSNPEILWELSFRAMLLPAAA